MSDSATVNERGFRLGLLPSIQRLRWQDSLLIAATGFGLAFYVGVPYFSFSPSLYAFCLLGALLITISTHDLCSYTIPLRLNELLLLSGLGASLLPSGIGISSALDGAVVGWIAIAGYNQITQWLAQHRALGQGDELLALGIGAWLGPEPFIWVLFKGLLISLWFLIVIRGLSAKWLEVIPFAPMLAVPTLVTVLHAGTAYHAPQLTWG